MFFTLLVLVAALALESLGSYISVVGLSQNTSVIIIFLAVLLDFVKVIIATTLYKKWNSIHLVLKSFLLPSLIGLMVVTSSGTYGYLIKEFGKTSVGQEEIAVKIQGMQEEKERIEARKKEIDAQIAALPANSVNQRKRLTDLFSNELNQINSRILELDKAIPEANLASVQGKSNGGNLASIANTYGMKPEQINKIVAFLITLMIDPLAIVLLTIANFLMEQNRKEKRENALKILKGELVVDDDDSIMQQLKNKMLFMKSKLSKDSIEVSRYLSESKPHIVRKPLMNKSKEKLHIVDFIYSTKLIENPRVIVPVKYSASVFVANIMNILKESRPIIIKEKPKKSLSNIKVSEFISDEFEIPPSYVVEPLKRLKREFLEEELLFYTDFDAKDIPIPSEKITTRLMSTQFIKSSEFIEFQEPISLDKKEYIEEAEFISQKENSIQTVEKNIVTHIPTSFIKDIREVERKKMIVGSTSVEIDSFLNDIEEESEEIIHEQEEAIIHEFIKNKSSSLKVVKKDDDVLPVTENLKKPVFKKPSIKVNENNIFGNVKKEYTLHLDAPIEYDEDVVFHDEFPDFQTEDLGDLVMKLWNILPEQEISYPGFDIKEILNMEEINV